MGVLRGHERPVEWLAYGPDGRRLCSIDARSGRLWDTETGRSVVDSSGQARSFTALFTPDGRRLIIGLDRRVCVYDATTGAETSELGTHERRVFRLAVSPDGRRLATCCSDHTARLWDVSTLQEVCELRGHEDYVHAVAFSPDGSRLASASGDLTVRIWDRVPPSVRALPPADPSSSPGGDSGRGRSPIPSDGTPARLVAPPWSTLAPRGSLLSATIERIVNARAIRATPHLAVSSGHSQ